jgi:Na+/H+-dicarboxylate symporter/ABC-type amino acid transport substrate-binding protein
VRSNEKKKMGLSARVFLALGLGVAAGIFFGELMASLEVVGNIFIRLFQMTVIPYVAVSLITAVGSLNLRAARELAIRAGSILLLLWVICLIAIAVMPLAYPQLDSASFFSTSLVEPRKSFDFVRLFVTDNPFNALANGIVPAIVLFSILLGLTLMGIEGKDKFLDILNVLKEALTLLNQKIVSFSPIGIFAIAAAAAGTLEVEQFGQLQVYLAVQAVFALLLGLWVLPGLISCLTPLRIKQVINAVKDPLLLAFATGNLLIVLPTIAERGKGLLRELAEDSKEAEPMLDVIVPTSFNFPDLGKLLSLGFVPFAAWFVGSSISAGQYPGFLAAGLASFFGDVSMAILFLLDMMRLPADLFQIYLAVDVLASRFGTLLAAMHTASLALMGACAMGGIISIRWKRLQVFLVITVIVTATLLGGMRLAFTKVLSNFQTKENVIASMQLLRNPIDDIKVHLTPPGFPDEDLETGVLQRIKARGAIRVGYFFDNIPSTYFNQQDELVGMDVEMAHQLARDLDVGLIFIPVHEKSFIKMLKNGTCEIIMSSLPVTEDRAQEIKFTNPYLIETLAFVVRDADRTLFGSRKAIQKLESLRIAIPNVPTLAEKLKKALPQAEVVILETLEEFFNQKGREYDALFLTAEAGSAWSILFPDYSVALPQPGITKMPVSYAVNDRDQEWLQFMNTWLELKKHDGTVNELYDYWVLGKSEKLKKPRWSVIRDVLGWVE